MNKMDYKALGIEDSLIEAAKKCNCKENDAYNPSGAGPANLPSAAGKINIADEKKKVEKECAMDSMKPGYNKTDRGYA